MRCWWPWRPTGTAELPQSAGWSALAEGRRREAREASWGAAQPPMPLQLTAGVAPPPPPVPYPQITTSLRKSMYFGVRRTWGSFSTPCCLSWPQTSLGKPEWG